jgi:hypothetical protein
MKRRAAAAIHMTVEMTVMENAPLFILAAAVLALPLFILQ